MTIGWEKKTRGLRMENKLQWGVEWKPLSLVFSHLGILPAAHLFVILCFRLDPPQCGSPQSSTVIHWRLNNSLIKMFSELLNLLRHNFYLLVLILPSGAKATEHKPPSTGNYPPLLQATISDPIGCIFLLMNKETQIRLSWKFVGSLYKANDRENMVL